MDKRLTEGDIITIFSQYGEIMDINLPRIPEGGLRHQSGMDAKGEAKLTNDQKQQQQSGKAGDRRGFGFILYEDQRSTILAVDNLNGFQLLNRTLRVDHVRDYKMPKRRNEEGEVEEPIGPSRNAAPQISQSETGSTSQQARQQDINDDDEEIDMEDPMAAYIARSKSASGNIGDDDKEERKRRKEQRRIIREERDKRRKERDSRDSKHDRADEKHNIERHHHSRKDDSVSRRERERSPEYSRSNDRYASGSREEGRDHHRYSNHHSSNRERERRSDSRRS